MIENQTILYGITGSVAAIKAPIVVRELMRRGANVQTVMTQSAEKFTTPYSLSTLTHHEAITSMFLPSRSTWHIHLGRTVRAMLIAPASAATLGKLRSGIYDNPVLLAASALPRTTPLVVAPAMDEEMWVQPAVQDTIRWLTENGVYVIEPVKGDLASGFVGMGRMKEPDTLVDEFIRILGGSEKGYVTSEKILSPLKNKKILISGGPTYEPVDAVRFIGNRSSGKMAAALADTAANMFGASVTLVMGPSPVQTSELVTRIDVETAQQMYESMTSIAHSADIIIMCAAVSDFKPNQIYGAKMKRDGHSGLVVNLIPTVDILRALVNTRRDNQYIVGFALESVEEGRKYAERKLTDKQLDMIVLNYYDRKGEGFNSDTNRITILTADGSGGEYPLTSKAECARYILEAIASRV